MTLQDELNELIVELAELIEQETHSVPTGGCPGGDACVCGVSDHVFKRMDAWMARSQEHADCFARHFWTWAFREALQNVRSQVVKKN